MQKSTGLLGAGWEGSTKAETSLVLAELLTCSVTLAKSLGLCFHTVE